MPQYRSEPDMKMPAGWAGICRTRFLFEYSALLAQPDHHVDPRDLVAFRGLRQLGQRQMLIRDVDQLVVVLEIEMVMGGDIGIEIGLGAVDADLTEQTRIGQLVQRIV